MAIIIVENVSRSKGLYEPYNFHLFFVTLHTQISPSSSWAGRLLSSGVTRSPPARHQILKQQVHNSINHHVYATTDRSSISDDIDHVPIDTGNKKALRRLGSWLYRRKKESRYKSSQLIVLGIGNDVSRYKGVYLVTHYVVFTYVNTGGVGTIIQMLSSTKVGG